MPVRGVRPATTMNYAFREYVRATSLPFTVVLQCVDPPLPVFYQNFGDEGQARNLFEKLKANEIKEGGGGEFSLTLFQHPKRTKINYMTTTDDSVSGSLGLPFVYAIDYPEAIILKEFSYMDYYEQLLVQEAQEEVVSA